MDTQLALARRGDRALLGIFNTKDQALASAWLSPAELKALAQRATEIADLLTGGRKAEAFPPNTCNRCGGSFPALTAGKKQPRYCPDCRPEVQREHKKRSKERAAAKASAIAVTASNDAPPSISVELIPESENKSASDPLELAKQRNRATIERLRKTMTA